MSARILDETKDLLRLYVHAAGESNVPVAFHAWACISMVAAALANRAWLETIRGQPLYPNLYIFLVGPSGTGKGVAIDTAMKFIGGDNPRIKPFNASKVTSEAITTRLASQVKRNDPAIIYLNTPEMALSVGRGERADNFIRFMTEMFTGRAYAMTESTVTRGDNALTGYCLNWLAGTTVEWLNDSIRKEDIAGGFFARVIPVVAARKVGPRRTFAIYPPDYDEVVEHIRERVTELSWLEGMFDFTDRARETFEQWDKERTISTDPLLAPSHERRAELVLKVAMAFAVMEDPHNLSIRFHHVVNAIAKVGEVMKGLPSLIDRASESADTQGITLVAEYLKQMKQCRDSMLLQYALRRGIGPKRLVELVNALAQAKQVQRVVGPAGRMLVWTGRKQMPKESA